MGYYVTLDTSEPTSDGGDLGSPTYATRAPPE